MRKLAGGAVVVSPEAPDLLDPFQEIRPVLAYERFTELISQPADVILQGVVDLIELIRQCCFIEASGRTRT